MMASQAREETYKDVERMVAGLCWKSIRRHGGEFNEVFAVANYSYSYAYENWDPSLSSFVTWVWLCVSRAIGDYRHQEKRHRQVGLVENRVLTKLPAKVHSGIRELAADLSEDAQTVIQVILDAPAELLAVIQPSPDKPGLLRAYLLALGWTARRVTESFSELREAFS